MAATDKPYCVYVYRDPRPGRNRVPVYVGAGLARSRPNDHWKGRSTNPRLADFITELKYAGLRPIIELVERFDRRDEALQLEKTLIDKFKATLCNRSGVGRAFPERVNIPIPPYLLQALDDWRRQQRDLPNRAAAVRRLLRQALRLPETNDTSGRP
jgi:hypothetical protein